MIEGSAAFLFAAARWLGYLAAFALMGAVVARHFVWPRAERLGGSRPSASRLAQFAVLAGIVLLVAKGMVLYFQTRSLLEPDEPLTNAFLRLVLDSEWGGGWTAQAVSAAVATVGWSAVGRWPAHPVAAWLAAIGAVGIASTAPLTGHAVGLPEAGRLGPALDGLHFGAAGAWLGTLATMAITALPRTGSRVTTRELFAAFSPVALTCGLVAMLSGGIMAYRYLGGLTPLVTTTYGQALLLKLVMLGGVAGVGAWNWRVALPHLRAGGDANQIKNTVRLELALGTLVLAVTAVLVALPAPGEH